MREEKDDTKVKDIKNIFRLKKENEAILYINIYHITTKISKLLIRITSKHKGDFCCLNCFYSFRTKTKLESHKNVREKNIFAIL